MGKLFGTDGVRGIANKELTSDLAFKLGQAGAYVLTGEMHHCPTIYVGTDTRRSCDMLECALIAGLCSVGANVVRLGVVPTPTVAYLTRKHKADAGVVISASHNSFEFNGIKFFNRFGLKLSDEIEGKIEDFILGETVLPHKTGEAVGAMQFKYEYATEYIDFLVASCDVDISNMNILIDCANGASYDIAPKVFEKLGVNVDVLYNEPNGININKNCGSTHIKKLAKKIKDKDYEIAFAFDGDADRVLAVASDGRIIDGDRIMGALAIYLKSVNHLNNNTIVSTIMSNMGLEKLAEKNGLKVIRTKVGDRYVVEEMVKNNYMIGGEQSGHIILKEYNTTGDGILTAIKILSMLKKESMTSINMYENMIEYPQVIINAKVKSNNKNDFFTNAKLMQKYKELENEFSGEGRVIIRPSGTEPVVRVMLEGKNLGVITKKAKEMAELVEIELG